MLMPYKNSNSNATFKLISGKRKCIYVALNFNNKCRQKLIQAVIRTGAVERYFSKFLSMSFNLTKIINEVNCKIV